MKIEKKTLRPLKNSKVTSKNKKGKKSNYFFLLLTFPFLLDYSLSALSVFFDSTINYIRRSL